MENFNKVNYTYEELKNAYLRWVNGVPTLREKEWNEYCDIRDRLPLGTTQKRSIKTWLREEKLWN